MGKGPEGLGLSPQDIDDIQALEKKVLESRGPQNAVNLYPTGDPGRLLPGETPEQAHIRLQNLGSGNIEESGS